MVKVICGFPGVGKTSLVNELLRLGVAVHDSDSSTFDKAQFPANYINHIKHVMADGGVIFASTHQSVREALQKENIEFTVVYPQISCKAEYLQRYRDRGSPEAFVELMDRMWEDFVVGCAAQRGCTHLQLKSGQFLSDVITPSLNNDGCVVVQT